MRATKRLACALLVQRECQRAHERDSTFAIPTQQPETIFVAANVSCCFIAGETTRFSAGDAGIALETSASVFTATFVLAILIGVMLGSLGGGGATLLVPVLTYVAGMAPRDAITT